MKSKLLIPAMLLAIISASCGSGTPADGSGRIMDRARECGRHDAMRVIEAPAGSYQREDALLAIVARASQLTDKGYVRAAQCYRQTAEQILRDSLIIQ